MNFFYSTNNDHFKKAGQEFVRLSRVPPRHSFSKEEIQLPEDGSLEEYGFNLPVLDKCYGGICYLLTGKKEKSRQIAQEIAQDPVFARMYPNQHLFTLFNMLEMNEQTTGMARKMKEEGDQTNFSRVAQVLSGISPSETIAITQTWFWHNQLTTLDGHPLFGTDGLDVFLTNTAVYVYLGQLPEVKAELEKAKVFLNKDSFFSPYRDNKRSSLGDGISKGMLPGAEIILCYTMFLTLRDVEGAIDPLLHTLQDGLVKFLENSCPLEIRL